MSVDINWETLTGGPDGAALAETIRDFIHERFQSIDLPKLIRSVSVHTFEFGDIAPEIVLKDIGNPLPDFYESDGDDLSPDEDNGISHGKTTDLPEARQPRHMRSVDGSRRQSELDILDRSVTSALSRGAMPGVLGATSNLGYFHHPLSAGLPGTQTPLAAVAGAHYPTSSQIAQANAKAANTGHSPSPPPSVTPASSQIHTYFDRPSSATALDDIDRSIQSREHNTVESSPEDLQVIFHITYAGDIKLSLTADVFLDYPMPSFVGIPLKLKITGLTFNGVGIVAHIKKRAHLCFLNPEDAEALIGGEPGYDPLDESGNTSAEIASQAKIGALLEDIKIESEMGETDSGKQVLKNVGKIEKFILEQVRHIFEEEFVYPNFWTFLV